MKYEITYSCGHNGVVDLFGSRTEREKKINYFEKYGLCPECYKEGLNAERSKGAEEIRMSYADYKNKYSNCKTKAGSYDPETKTIIVYVPKKDEKEEEIKEMAKKLADYVKTKEKLEGEGKDTSEIEKEAKEFVLDLQQKYSKEDLEKINKGASKILYP